MKSPEVIEERRISYLNMDVLWHHLKHTGSIRRYYLDCLIMSLITEIDGDIIDIGGKKSKARGYDYRKYFQHDPLYINIDQATEPDICCCATGIPVDSCCMSIGLMIELIEHVLDPKVVIKEASRILRGGGLLLISSPFLYPIHADPHDYARYTPKMVDNMISEAEMVLERYFPMGGLACVVYDMVFSSVWRIESRSFRLLLRVFLRLSFLPALALDLLSYRFFCSHITSGWFFVIRKE